MRSHAWLVSVKLLNFSYRPPAGLPERVLWSQLPWLVYGNELFLSSGKTAELGYYKCRETAKQPNVYAFGDIVTTAEQSIVLNPYI